MNRNFACSGLKYKACNLNNIANVPSLELCEHILAHIVHTDICLYSAVAVLNVDKISLAHITPSHNSAGNGYILIFEFIKVCLNFVAVMSLCSKSNLKRISAAVLKCFELIYTNLLLLIFGQNDLCHSHLCGISVVAYLFDNIKNLCLGIRIAAESYCACLEEQCILNLIAVSLYEILWISLFFIILESVLDFHTAVLLNCLYASLAGILFFENRRRTYSLIVYQQLKCESAVTLFGDFKLSCHK